jgi:SAM-dependent methyltransferase
MTAAARPAPAWRALVEAASAPYRAADKFAWHFARGKLGGDPVFRHVLERGLIKPDSRVLDIGCGQGLLASLLHACGVAARAKRWPAGWAAAPAGVHVTGIELMPHDIKRCEIALGGAATFVCGDMRTVEFPQVDAVVIFDALHYIAPADQDAVLARVRGALKRGGVLLLRVGNASKRRRFALGQWIDRDHDGAARRRLHPARRPAARAVGRDAARPRLRRRAGADERPPAVLELPADRARARRRSA